MDLDEVVPPSLMVLQHLATADMIISSPLMEPVRKRPTRDV